MKTHYDETDDIQGYWSQRHEAWARSPVWATYPAKQAWFNVRFAHLLPPVTYGVSGRPVLRGSVLDYGCGCGLYAMPLVQRYACYLGFDVSVAAIQLANQYHQDKPGYYNFQVYVGEPGHFLDGTAAEFDLILSVTVLQHQPIPYRLAMIENIKQLLKPTGRYIGLEWIGQTAAFDMPPMREEDWIEAWKPLKIVPDLPPEHPDYHADHVWLAELPKD